MKSGTTGGLTSCCAILALLSGCATTTGGGQVAPDAFSPTYHVMMAEIAAERGASVTAAEEYLNAAELSDEAEMSERAARYAFEYGLDANALRAARRWAQLAPDDSSVQLLLARLLIRQNDVAAATSAAARALGPVSERAEEDYLLLGAELSREDNDETITRVLTRLVVQAPDSPALRLALGNAALESGDLDIALASAQSAQTGETAENAALLIGRILLARDEGQAALDYITRQISANPSLDLELEHARLLAAVERHGDSLAELSEITQRYGNEPEVIRLRALVSLDADDPKTAWEQFTELLMQGEASGESFFYMGEIAAKQGQPDRAAELYGRVPDGPYLLPAQIALARIAREEGGYAAVEQHFAELIRRYPQIWHEVTPYRAEALARLGQNEAALQLFDDALVQRPADVDLLLGRGALLERMNHVDAALADMEKAVRIAPDSALALNAYGYTLANRTKRHADAWRAIRRAVERAPGNAAILDSFGWAFYRLGKLPEARSYLQLAHSQFQDPEVAAHLGEIMWQQGQREEARALWSAALEKDPDSEPLISTMTRFMR